MSGIAFDKAYFDAIWGSVHRHDYCETLADQLIEKYGKCRILDIGTGCGYLVKTLRDKGCDAYGLEVSPYAVDNSHGNVLLGDVRDMPFKDGQFDVIFSQGLWEYIPEEDVEKAITECRRVGKNQEHNFEYEGCDNPPEHQMLPLKPLDWWQEQWYPKVLVACPTHLVKEYAMQEWVDCVNALDYPNYDILLVDNSPTTEVYDRWKDKVPMVYLPDQDQSEIASARINASMQVIQKKFLSGNYKWWFNLEIDVIVPPEMLKTLMRYPSDWTSHDYEVRGGGGRMTGIGCSLLSRSIAEAANFASDVHGPDAELWTQTQNTHKTLTLTNWLDVKHIGNGTGYGG